MLFIGVLARPATNTAQPANTTGKPAAWQAKPAERPAHGPARHDTRNTTPSPQALRAMWRDLPTIQARLYRLY